MSNNKPSIKIEEDVKTTTRITTPSLVGILDIENKSLDDLEIRTCKNDGVETDHLIRIYHVQELEDLKLILVAALNILEQREVIK